MFNIIDLPIEKLVPYNKNPRKNENAVKEVIKSLKKFGFQQCIVVDKDYVVIAGHTRLQAAKELGLKTVPVKITTDLTEAQIQAYRIMDNRTSEFAEWDRDLLLEEIQDIELKEIELTADFMGFELERLDEPASMETWDTNAVNDEFVVTVTGPLTKQGEILNVLKDFHDDPDFKIEASHIQRKK